MGNRKTAEKFLVSSQLLSLFFQLHGLCYDSLFYVVPVRYKIFQ